MRSVSFTLCICSFFIFCGVTAQTVPAGYTVSILNGSLPASREMGEMAIDPNSGNIYYAGSNTTGFMDRIEPTGTYTTLSSTWCQNVNYWHPYVGTDIEYYNNEIYCFARNNASPGNNGLIKYSPATNTTTIVSVPSPVFGGNETGAAFIGNTIYVTDGGFTNNRLYSYNLNDSTWTTGMSIPGGGNESLEYNEYTNTLYFSADNNLYKLNLITGTYSLVSNQLLNAESKFAIDPKGEFAYSHSNSTINKINLTTGVASTFGTGYATQTYLDIEFGPSSAGCGTSLYVGGTNRIYEIKGWGGVEADTVPTSLCLDIVGYDLAIPYTAGCGTYNPGNVFTAQLSDSAGNFTTYTVLGSDTSLVSDTIHAHIPGGIPAGTNYKIRIVASNLGAVGKPSSAILIGNTPSNLIASATDTVICLGFDPELSVSGASNYLWLPDSSTSANPNIIPDTTSTYIVIGSDIVGCSNSDTIIIWVNPLPVVTAGTSDPEICVGDTVAVYGNGAVSYVWDNGVTNNIYFEPAGSNTYYVTGTDANGCQDTSLVYVLVNDLPTIGHASSPSSTVCYGESLALSGTGAASYIWTGGITDNSMFTPTISGTYTVTGTDVNGCINTSTAGITVNSLPPVMAFADADTICPETMVTFTGSGAVSYVWDNGVINGIPVAVSATNTYMVIGTDANGCQDTNTVDVNVYALPTVGFTSFPATTVCLGNTVTLFGTGAGSYSWSGGVINSFGFFPLGNSTYTVTGTDNHGCTNTATANITVNPLPVIDLGSDIIQPNLPAIIDAGAGYSSYLWNTTANTQTISVNNNGVFIATVTDTNGCANSDTISVAFTAGINGAGDTETIVQLYPNPSNGSFTVQIQNMIADDVRMEVVDLTGKLISQKIIGEVNDSAIELFMLQDLKGGIYILRITANEKTTQLKFIINQ